LETKYAVNKANGDTCPPDQQDLSDYLGNMAKDDFGTNTGYNHFFFSAAHKSTKGCVRTFNLDDIVLLIIANDKSLLKYRLDAVGVVVEEKCKYLFPRHMKFSEIGKGEGEMMMGDKNSGFVSICTKKVGFANMVRFYGCQIDICIAFVVPKSTFKQRILKLGDVEFYIS